MFFTPPDKNFLIVFKLDTWSRDLKSDFTLNDCLFGGVKLAKSLFLEMIWTHLCILIIKTKII